MVNTPAPNFLKLKEVFANEKLKMDEMTEEEEEEEEEQGGEEEEEDEWEEEEIERIIQRSSHFLKRDDEGRTLPQSCSAHANLSQPKRQKWQKTTPLELDDEKGGEEGEDSDEELFAQHSSLLPLRKSKSAFAGFQSPRVGKSTAPFDCPIVIRKTIGETADESAKGGRVVKKEDGEQKGGGIEELIDLARGDVLQFRMSHRHVSPSRSCSSSASSLPVGAQSETEDELGAWEERIDVDQGRSRRNFLLSDRSTGGSWSAPSGFISGDHKRKGSEKGGKRQETEGGVEEEVEELDNLNKFGGQLLQNMKHLEIDGNGWHFRKEEEDGMEEKMSTTTDEEENDDEHEDRVACVDSQKQMRVFVSKNCYPITRCRRNMPNSRSDSQLLWNRHLTEAAPPPPAAFPLEESEEDLTGEPPTKPAKTTAIAHSKTHVGLMTETVEEEQKWKMEEKKKLLKMEEEQKWKMEEKKKLLKMEEEQKWKMEEKKKLLKMGQMEYEKETEEMCPQKSAFAPSADSFGEDLSNEQQQLKNVPQRPYPILFRRQRQAQQAKVLAIRMSLPNPPFYYLKQPNLAKNRSASSVDDIPMVDDCPSPNQSLLPGYDVLSPIRKRNVSSAKLATAQKGGTSLSSSPNYSEDEKFEGDEKKRCRTMRKGRRIPVQRSAAERLCRRGSPPHAQNDLLSESEISDLEQQIASGRLERNGNDSSTALGEFLEKQSSEEVTEEKLGEDRLNEEEEKEEEEKEEEEEEEEEKEEEEEEEEEKEEEGEDEREAAEAWGGASGKRGVDTGRGLDVDRVDEEEAEEGMNEEATSSEDGSFSPERRRSEVFDHNLVIGTSSSMPTFPFNAGNNYWGGGKPNFWQGESPTEDGDNPWGEETILQRSVTVQSALEGGAGKRRRRRMLPLRPDQQGRTRNAEECPPSPTVPSSFSAKHRRQLPRIPSSEDPLDKINIFTSTKEHLLNALQQQKPSERQRRIEQMHIDRADQNEGEFSQTMPNLPSPTSVVQLSKVPLSLCGAELAHRSQRDHCHHRPEEYTLSYGMDQSALGLARKGLSIEESYYEDVDGLNGNLTYGGGKGKDRREWGDSPHSPDCEEDRIRVSLYNIADGNKSSSGISSSCCTTSSRSCELPETNRFVLARRQRQKARDYADPSVPTHRSQFPFMPRHVEQVELQKGDALHIFEKYEDHWCHGVNLRTGHKGIFPEAHIVEIDLVDEICRSVLPDGSPHPIKIERDTFYLTMMASIEVAHHKGNDVLMQAINKVCAVYQQKEEILVPQTVLMEVSFRGVHVIDKRKRDIFRCPTFDFFFSLQNISFCGAHPKELRYFGFITKHPILPRFACHVFLSSESTEPIVEAIGRAFKRSYDEYMAFAHPTEDIFIE
uniref:Uncharacterized protein n=1 Tax=Globodera rostochiensis TaxID=31243 RepID=A0A914HGR7_GLORO